MGKIELKIEIDADLLARAKAAGVQVELVMQESVRAALASRSKLGSADDRAAQWARDNHDAITDYNRRISSRGVFSDGLRTW